MIVARTTPLSPLKVQAQVIHALILRDVRTRFFGHGLGYLIAIAWPLVHLTILVVINSVVRRTTPYGSSIVLYFATALIPVMAFMYGSRWTMLSIIANRPLLVFPNVKVIDVIVARGILEGAASYMMAGCVILTLFLMDIDVVPYSVLGAMEALSAAVLLGFGVGLLNGVIALGIPMWATGYALTIILLYMSAGVVFDPNSLPELARKIVSWNPVLHTVEWMRQSYFEDYASRTLDKQYLFSFGFGSLFAGLLLERVMRRYFLQG